MVPVTLPHVLGLIGDVDWSELLILALIGVMIFGKRLPEVGRSLGRGIAEFKKGLAGIEDEIHRAGNMSSMEPDRREAVDDSPSVDAAQAADRRLDSEPAVEASSRSSVS